MRPAAVAALAIAAIAAGAGAYYYFGPVPHGPGAGKSGPPAAMRGGPPGGFAMPVEAVAARSARLERAILAVGTLRSNQSVVVRPEIAGRIARIHFSEGQKVAAGTRLVTLDDSIARAEVAQARASLSLSKANYQRATELLQKGAGTVRARDEAVAKLRNDEATLALVQAKLEKTVISAPFHGIIGLRKVDVGEYVAVGQDIANLEDVDPMKVDFRVPESFLAAVAPGQRVAVSADAWTDRAFPGEVYAIDPMIDDKGRSIVIRARIANTDGLLRPGLFVRVRLVLTVTENAVLIPEEALIPIGTSQFVFVIRDGKAVNIRVEIGDRQGTDVQVLSGLAAGDMVVTAGQIKLRPGIPVMVVPPGGGQPPNAKPGGGQPPNGKAGGGKPPATRTSGGGPPGSAPAARPEG